MNKQGLILDKVVLLGRTSDEYVRYFALDPAALRVFLEAWTISSSSDMTFFLDVMIQ